MRAAHRARIIPAVVAVAGLLVGAGADQLHAHGTEARRVVPMKWSKPRIARVLDVNRSKLDLNGSKAPAAMKTVDGMSCIFGDLFAFDVEDTYAFDIDEPVQVTVAYAPATSQPFTVAWDRNSGEGYGAVPVTLEPGAAIRRTTVTLDRARFAGLGILKTDLAIGARGGVTICDVAIARSNRTPAPALSGTIKIQVRDADTGSAVPARMGLYDATGRTPLPSMQAAGLQRYADETRLVWTGGRLTWPSTNRQVFYVSGEYQSAVPAGTYELITSRGPEYRLHKESVTVAAGKTTEVTVTMRRFANQPERGWYSGDTHIHLAREQVQDMNIWAMTAGEDVHVGNLLEMGNIVTHHFQQPAWGPASRFLRDGHMIVSGQEGPRTQQRGHTIHHNLKTSLHLPPDEYFSYHKVFEESHRQGGVSGYAHHGQIFNGRRGLVMDVPFGLVDFIEVLQGGRLDTRNWYPFLDLGFKVNPAAGSDYPYFGPSLPGVERYYVKLDGPFNADAWYQSFRAGHVFVTNGPLVDFTINGVSMGEEVKVTRGADLNIAALARLNPDFDGLGKLEVIAHGKVIATIDAGGKDQAELKTTIKADHSMWVALRVTGKTPDPGTGFGPQSYVALAHTAPIYVIVDGAPFWNTEAVPQLVKEQQQILQELLTAPVDPVGDLEAWETVPTLAFQWERQRGLLRARADEADARYKDILVRATGSSASHRDGLTLFGLVAVGFVGFRLWERKQS